jgi:hypothetical protein
MEVKIEAELITKHLTRIQRHAYNMSRIIWNISFIMKKYSDDEYVKAFCKNIVLSIQTCYLTIDEMWETVSRLYKGLNAYIKSKYEKLVAYHDSDNNNWVRPLDLFLKKFEKWEDKSRLKYKLKALNSIIEMKNNIRRMRIWLRDIDWCSD